MEPVRFTYEQQKEYAEKIIAMAKGRNHRIICLEGPLGAGKTTLTQMILSLLGVTGPIQSPTYTYVSTYTSKKNEPIYHFDLYRITNASEFVESGFDEYIHMPQSWSFIEWPGVIDSWLPEERIVVKLSYGDAEDVRFISIAG